MKIFKKVQIYIYKKNENIQYLLLKRSFCLGNYWQGITGKVEKNETFEQAGIREAYEETGLTIFNKIIGPVSLQNFNKNNKSYQEAVFGIEVQELDVKLSLEHTEYCWLKYEEAYEMLYWDENKKGLLKLKEKLLSL
ncbi:MAG: NUDIX domain-containing protein [bacterium]